MAGVVGFFRKHYLLAFGLLAVVLCGGGVWFMYQTMLAAKPKARVEVERKYHHHNLLDVDFGDKDQGWIVGYKGLILHSFDGGLTWKRQVSNTLGTLAGVDFINKDVGWAVGLYGTILHTKDGGRHWVKQESEADPLSYICDVQFFDENEGWACGNMGVVLHTVNGGEEWELVDIEEYVDWDTPFNRLKFIDKNNGWLVGENGICMHTLDGGETWEVLRNLGTLKTLYGVDFLTRDFGFIVGADGVLLMTKNGGRSWIKPKWKATPVESHIFQVCMKASEEYNPASNLGLDIYAVGRGTILHTYGSLQKNWERIIEVDRPIKYTWFYGMCWPTDHIGVAVGEDGLILRTWDEGLHWVTIEYGYEYEETGE